jgi:Fe-S oxidoreductase
MGIEIKEMESHGRTNLCCGGGGGVILMESAQGLRRKAFTLKREDVDNTGATDVAVSCGGCRTTLETGKAETNWNINIHSLVEMVADRLAS